MSQGRAETGRLEDLEQKVRELQQEIRDAKSNQSDSDSYFDLAGGLMKRKGLTIGFYGESKYRFPEAGSDKFDPHRFVLIPGYEISDWLIFNSEIEFEHGGIDENSGTSRSRFNGEVELEQMYVDILINEHFNIRSLGILLIPVGRINPHHEPTTFYSTERPELYTQIIPSTWFEPALGAFGKITENLHYQFVVSTGLEDFTANAPTTAGITGSVGVRNSRPRLRDANEDRLAYSGKLRFSGITGLDASTSFYTTKVLGQTGTSELLLLDVEALYRVPHTGFEFRGEAAYWDISDPQNLIANNSTATDVGATMYGWYVEAAHHFWPEAWKHGRAKDMDFVPFVRYTDIITQENLPAGAVEIDNGTTNRDFLTIGAALFLNENVVVKADYRMNLNDSAASATDASAQDYFQVGAGVSF